MGYIHSYSKDEQDRLVRQAELLEPHLHQYVDLSGCQRILEIGCGVGAQLRLLSRKHPDKEFVGVDISDDQIQQARLVLAKEIATGQLELVTTAGEGLPFPNGSFDAVYICFVLEHALDPQRLLQEAKRVLVTGGLLYCTEVFNDALYIYPHSPAIMQYWRAFNECQRKIGGDPNIGICLGNVMIQAGLEVEWLRDASYMVDQRMTDPALRANYFNHWHANFVSAKEQMLAEGAVTSTLLLQFEQEFEHLRHCQDSVFLYSNRQVRARKPPTAGITEPRV